MRREMEGGRGESEDEDTEGEEDSERGERGGPGNPKERKSARRGYEQKKAPLYEPLEGHHVFKQARVNALLLQSNNSEGWGTRIALNLIAYDGLGRLFVWDSERKLLHFVEIQRSDSLDALGSSESTTLLASKKLKTVRLSSSVDFQVRHLAFNRTGRSLVLAGDGAVMVVNLLVPSSTSSTGICRVQKVGAERIFSKGGGHWLRILQIGWHPYSDTHLCILSSDGSFRIFDLSLDSENAEQEYHLQPRSSERGSSTTLSRAMAFAFGGEHLWDRFTVFILYNDGTVFAICPIVPFGSMFTSMAINELVKDSRRSELLVGDPNSMAETSFLALAWLESVFPELVTRTNAATGELSGSTFVLKAHAYVPLDASVVLQGPLATLCKETHVASCEAVGLLYNVVGKDSVIAVSTKDGQVQVYVLADELQPTWDVGRLPQLAVDDKGHILSVGMLVEALTDVSAMGNRGEYGDSSSSVWPSRIPPLLQIGVIDLALQPTIFEACPITLFADPVVPERLYCQHAAGLDAILLQSLPFSTQSNSNASSGALPSAFPMLDICPTGFTTPRPLLGVALFLDSLGESWVVSVTANCECAVVNMKPHRILPVPVVLDGESNEEQNSGAVDVGVFQMMSRELLLGPKDIPLTQLTSLGAPLTLDTIEGRTFLHDQCKLLHEKYIEYAHRVYVELTSHGSRLHDIVQEQHRRVTQAEEKLKLLKEKSFALVHRIQQAVLRNEKFERRVKVYSSLPGVSEKPLTVSEREFKAKLDIMRLQDLDILKSAVEVLSVRSERFLDAKVVLSQHASPYKSSPEVRNNRVAIPESQMRRLKQAVEHLTHVVDESSMKVRVIDESVSHQELLEGR